MRFRFLLFFLLLGNLLQAETPVAKTVLIAPFENVSTAPGLEWIGESFPIVLGQRLASPSLTLLSRDDRIRAFDSAGIPVGVHPSRAMLYRFSEQLDANYLVLGRYNFDGRTFTAIAQLLDVKAARLSREVSESGPLTQLITLQTALAWDLLRLQDSTLIASRDAFVAAATPIRLDALENYTRGILAGTPHEKIGFFREALRVSPDYPEAALALGQVCFIDKQYDAALAALAKVPPTHPAAGEAEFISGLSYYYTAQYDKAENTFRALMSRVPLPEIYNNLGVMQARRGKRAAIDQFQQASQIDATDSDYRFNLALALLRNGEAPASARILRDFVTSHPLDPEAKSAFEIASSADPPRAGSNDSRLPLERIKHNYDENSFRQIALQIQAINEQKTAGMPPTEHARFHVTRGQELLGQGFPAEAEREFSEAVQLDSSNPDAHLGLARTLELRNDFANTRKEAESATTLRPSAEGYLLLARLDLRENKTQEAAEKVERALQMEPTNSVALNLKRTIAAKLAEKAQPLSQP